MFWYLFTRLLIQINIMIFSDFEIKGIKCKDKNQEETEQAVTHSKFELHPKGDICMTIPRSDDRRYQVFILSPKLKNDLPAISFYQSARFVCEYDPKTPEGPHCKLADPEYEKECNPKASG